MISFEMRVDRLSSEKEESQKELDRVKEQHRAVSGEVEELRRVIEEIKCRFEIGKQNLNVLEEKERGGAGKGNECEAARMSGDEGGRSGYVSEESDEERENDSASSGRPGGGEGKENGATSAAGGGLSANGANDTIEREYLKCVPERMSVAEYEWELKERRRRKNNLVIRGVGAERYESMHEVKQKMERKLGIRMEIKRCREGREGIVVEMGSVRNKIEVMRRKGGLKETGWWVDDDFTEREKRVQEWLRKIEEEETRNGLRVKIGYMKIRVEGIWYKWDEEKGQIREMSFRNSGGREE